MDRSRQRRFVMFSLVDGGWSMPIFLGEEGRGENLHSCVFCVREKCREFSGGGRSWLLVAIGLWWRWLTSGKENVMGRLFKGTSWEGGNRRSFKEAMMGKPTHRRGREVWIESGEGSLKQQQWVG